MRVLIADRLHASALDELASLPVEVEYAPDLTRDALVERIEHVGILEEIEAFAHRELVNIVAEVRECL